MDCITFLKRVWKPLDGGYVFLGHKDWEFGASSFEEIPLSEWNPPQVDNLNDVYFCPNGFAETSRKLIHAHKKAHWLYADLDEVNPEYLGQRPQVAWETSPGNYQAMWRLATPLGPRAFERLNKALTYHVKADKGGWSYTKYLRPPGTVSHKHEEPFTVRLLWWDNGTTDNDDLRRIVKDALPALDVASGPIRLPKATAKEIRHDHWAAFSPRLRKLLRQRVLHPGDDRSARLWEVENLCLKAGLTPGQTVRVAAACVYNKYKGQRREYRKLMEEVSKAEAMQASQVKTDITVAGSVVHFNQDPETEDQPSFFTKAHLDLLGHVEPPDYVIHNVIARGQVCILSADSGVGKSWVALDLVVACVLRDKWLGRSVVGRKVVYVDEENGLRILAGRLRGLIRGRKPLTKSMNALVERNLHLCSRNGVSIGDESQQPELEAIITDLTPSLLIIDTAMSATAVGEVNDNSAVVALMKKLRYLAEKYSLAVVLMHHDRKPTGDDAADPRGTSMMGARQWSGQADAHLTIAPLDRNTQDLSNGKRGLTTDVILSCAKLRDDVPFDPEHLRIASIKDASGRIATASVKTLGPAPDRSSIITTQASEAVHELSDKPPAILDALITGEFIPLQTFADALHISVRAARSRAKRYPGYEVGTNQGRAVVTRLE